MIPSGAAIYFLGIGGIGMSALARYYRLMGHPVSGYDRTRTPLTDQLAAEGIPVYYEQDAARIAQAGAVIYTPAVKDGPEAEALRRLTVPVLKRAEALGQISRQRRTVAVAGTHGKTTTTSLASHLQVALGMDPTCFVGGIAANLGSNFRYGTGAWVVTEADEFDRSFLQLRPEVAVLTSVDADHLDIYGSAGGVEQSYADFVRQVEPSGVLLAHDNLCDWVRGLAPAPSCRVLFYGESAEADWRAVGVRAEGLTVHFTVVWAGGRAPVALRMPGRHNVANALAAIGAAVAAGAQPEAACQAVGDFRGVKRRFEVYLDGLRLSYVDDYAHHPTELEALIAAARAAYPDRRLALVFQPHLYSRTRDFFEGFAEVLSRADRVVLAPIYPARELPIVGVTSEALASTMPLRPPVVPLPELVPTLRDWATEAILTERWVLLTAGAGDIDTVCEPLSAALRPLL